MIVLLAGMRSALFVGILCAFMWFLSNGKLRIECNGDRCLRPRMEPRKFVKVEFTRQDAGNGAPGISIWTNVRYLAESPPLGSDDDTASEEDDYPGYRWRHERYGIGWVRERDLETMHSVGSWQYGIVTEVSEPWYWYRTRGFNWWGRVLVYYGN